MQRLCRTFLVLIILIIALSGSCFAATSTEVLGYDLYELLSNFMVDRAPAISPQSLQLSFTETKGDFTYHWVAPNDKPEAICISQYKDGTVRSIYIATRNNPSIAKDWAAIVAKAYKQPLKFEQVDGNRWVTWSGEYFHPVPSKSSIEVAKAEEDVKIFIHSYKEW